jgi:hypothetical protein
MTDKIEKQPKRKPPKHGNKPGGEDAPPPDSRERPVDDNEFERGMLGDDDFPDTDISPDVDTLTPYEIGYGRPPKEHQFQPGQSGNPAGRRLPPGPVGLSEALLQSAYKTERVQKGGRTVKMSRIAIMADRLITQALMGSIKDMDTVIKMLQRLGVYQVEQELQRISDIEEARQAERGWTPEMERRLKEIEADFFE